MSKSGPSSKKACVRESPHTCCIPQFLTYTSVYKGSTAFWPAASGTQCKAKIRVNLSWGGEEKRQFCWQLRERVHFAPTTKHKTQTPFSSFSSSQQILFLQRVSYLPAERSHKTQVVTKLTPLKIIFELFQKGYKKNFKSEKRWAFLYLLT